MVDEGQGHHSSRVEPAFESVDRAAAAAVEAGRVLQGAAKAVAKASVEGDLVKLRKAVERLEAARETANAAARSAATAWPFTPEAEEQALQEHLAHEVIGQGRRIGMDVSRLDDALAAFPALLHLQPERRSVVLSGKRIPTVRPKRIAELMAKDRGAKPKLSAERFVEVLYRAYRYCVGDDIGRGVTLVEAYDVLTVHPDMRRDYGRSEFLRDVHLLDRSGVTATKSGARVAFPASTGTKGSSRAFTIIDSNGHPVTYYSVRFYEDGR